MNPVDARQLAFVSLSFAMAPLSFLRPSSSSNASPGPPQPSPGRSASQTRNRSPSPEPVSTPSKYNPARLLRRKPSSSQKTATRASIDLQPPVPAMLLPSSEQDSSEHETEEPRTASSAFFSDIGDRDHLGNGVGLGLGSSEEGPLRTFGSPRSKRDGGIWSTQGVATVLMDAIPDRSPTQQTRSPQLGSEDHDSKTPTTPSSRRIMDPAELLHDNGLSSQAQMNPAPSHLLDRPITPPSAPPADHPFYPTALSPPRRPMPKSSPRPNRSTPPLQPPHLVSSSSFSAFPPDERPRHVSSPSLDSRDMTRSTASASSSSNSYGNGLIVDLADAPPEQSPRRPVVSAEWLARKPSSSKLGRKNSLGASRVQAGQQETQSGSPAPRRKTPQKIRSAQRAYIGGGTDSDSPSISQDSDADVTLASGGIVGKRRSVSTRDGYEVEVSCDDSQWPGPEDESGELVWQVKIRRQPRPQSNDPSLSAGPSSPLHLSTGSSRAVAPGSASSINLSLSLDQPTGKLVFIAFPMDLHATPRRRGSTSHHRRTAGPGPPTPPLPPSPRDLFSAGAATARPDAAPAPTAPDMEEAPSTPPPAPRQPSTPQSRSSSRLDRPEYPVTPTRVRLSGQFSPAGAASPRSRGSSSIARSLSPAFSNGTPGNGYTPPGAYTTPTSASRRTRLVTAPDLEGGLYAPGTIDGLSEKLESGATIR